VEHVNKVRVLLDDNFGESFGQVQANFAYLRMRLTFCREELSDI